MAPKKVKRLALLWLWLRRRREQRQHRHWIHPILKSRNKCGEFHHLFADVSQDSVKFREYLRMELSTFELLCRLCESSLQKKNTNFRDVISPKERLVVTLRYLAIGASFRSLAFSFRMGVTTVQKICSTLWQILQLYEMPSPDEKYWQTVADGFYKKWQFPNCIGAIDGKHVEIKAPNLSGSLYWNYKGYPSIVFIAVVDSFSRYIAIEVGAYGSSSDGGIFQDTNLYHLLSKRKLNIPMDQPFPSTDITMPFVFVGDEAFPLEYHLMRPYPRRTLTDTKRIYNYRLSRARRVVECTFGISSNMWRIFLKPIEVQPEFACDIIKSVCILHNFILNNEPHRFRTLDSNDFGTEPVQLMRGHEQAGPRRPSNKAMEVREKFADYFVSPIGSVPWQITSCLI